MGESKKTAGWRRVLFDRPVLKLCLVLLFTIAVSTLARYTSIRPLKFIIALLMSVAVVYAVALTGHIVSICLIRKPLDRLLRATDIFSLLLSYVMFVAGIILLISVLFMVAEDLHVGYLTRGPTSDSFNSDVIESGDPNISHDYLYYTTITFFTVGYGDICPMGFCKVLAMLTAFAGNCVTVVLMGIVVSVFLSRRTPPGQASSTGQGNGDSPAEGSA